MNPTLARLDEEEVTALTAFGEARNQPVLGIVGVLSVLNNRKRNGHWGSSFLSVCLAPMQFSCWNDDDPNQPKLLALAQLMVVGSPLPYDPALLVCRTLAAELVAGLLQENVQGAMFYAVSTLRPSWAHPPAEMVAIIGAHAFYTGVAV